MTCAISRHHSCSAKELVGETLYNESDEILHFDRILEDGIEMQSKMIPTSNHAWLAVPVIVRLLYFPMADGRLYTLILMKIAILKTSMYGQAGRIVYRMDPRDLFSAAVHNTSQESLLWLPSSNRYTMLKTCQL